MPPKSDVNWTYTRWQRLNTYLCTRHGCIHEGAYIRAKMKVSRRRLADYNSTAAECCLNWYTWAQGTTCESDLLSLFPNCPPTSNLLFFLSKMANVYNIPKVTSANSWNYKYYLRTSYVRLEIANWRSNWRNSPSVWWINTSCSDIRGKVHSSYTIYDWARESHYINMKYGNQTG